MKLTSALKKKVTEDWWTLFPQMGVYQPMWLARRAGPLVQGVCLERDPENTAYLPMLHLHNLCRPFPVVSLSLGQPLLSGRSGMPEWIKAQFHEQKWQDAARRLATASLLPLVGDLSVADVLNAYRAYQNMGRPDSAYPVPLFEDAISLLCWSGQPQAAAALLDEYVKEMRGWREDVMTRYGGVSGWKERMLEVVRQPELVRATAEASAVELKVTELPLVRLVA